ncbi:putative leader peptide [Rhodococcus sp. DT1]
MRNRPSVRSWSRRHVDLCRHSGALCRRRAVPAS